MATNHVSICGILYEGWETLDLLGPLAVLHKAGTIAQRTGRGSATIFLAGQEQRIYSSPQGAASYPQKTFAQVDEVDVLVCPGGFSAVVEANNRTMLDFVKRVEPKAKLVTSVCSGAAIYAKAGILDEKTATTNKAFYDMLITYGPRTTWTHKARFVVDGKFATSSGVSAGIDMAFAVVEKLWGADVKTETATEVGYAPAGETEDPFADVHGRMNSSLAYIASTGLRFVAPLLTPTIVNSVRKKSSKKRTIYVPIVEGMTNSLGLATAVECWGAPMVADHVYFQFIHLHAPDAPATSPKGFARTSDGILLETSLSLAWDGQLPSSISPTSRDLVLVAGLSVPTETEDLLSKITTPLTTGTTAAAAPTVVTIGATSTRLSGAPSDLLDGASKDAKGYVARDSWLVCASEMAVGGAAVEVVERWLGAATKKKVVDFVELRVPGGA